MAGSINIPLDSLRENLHQIEKKISQYTLIVTADFEVTLPSESYPNLATAAITCPEAMVSTSTYFTTSPLTTRQDTAAG